MARLVLPPVAFVLCFASAVPAGPRPQAKDGGPDRPQQPSPQIIPLDVSLTPAPVPAFRYELLPSRKSRTPGNAAVDYQRAVIRLPQWPRDPQAAQQLNDDTDRWHAASLDEYPHDEVATFLKGYEQTFAALDRAATRERCDWQLDDYLGPDHLDGLLNEVQKYRELTRFNSLRLRAHLAKNDFDAAIRDLRAGFRLGKDVAEGPTTIRMLVGLALVGVTTGDAEKWIGRPEAPNLYWALASLPAPFIDPRPALDGEFKFVSGSLPQPEELSRGVLEPAKANQLLEEVRGAVCRLGACPVTADQLGAYAARHAAAARTQLVAMGQPADAVKKMPDAQAVALRATLVLRANWDDVVKCFGLPYEKATAELARIREAAEKLRKGDDPLLAIYATDAAAMLKVHYAYVRVQRRLAGLQAVEAVRLHAATSGGKLPATLADVTAVPIPDDPISGRPFVYATTDAGFTLAAPPPAGEVAHAGNSFRYEVTVRKK
ncbi:MAG TPA: hypothetical protein VM529_24755 [Gemmata sp.]|nr:hypothetical protein [Gemmata sp.]